MTNVPPNLKKK